MNDIKEGAAVKCAECGKDAVVKFVDDYDGITGYELSCLHRNSYCVRCQRLARDVSDSGSEIHIFCENCLDDSDYEEDYSYLSPNTQSRKTSTYKTIT